MSTVFITGASSGIGKELCTLFAQKSYNLILLARRTKKLEELQKHLIKEYKIHCQILSYDLSNPEELENVIPPYDFDILINCAGFGEISPFEKLTVQTEKEMLQVNLLSPIQLTRLFLEKAFKKQKGTIINVCSTAALYYHPYMAIYSASKVALLQYSISIQAEIQKKYNNIFVLSVCPGPTNTNFFPKTIKEKFGLFQSWEMSSRKVAQKIIEAFEKKKIFTIIGFRNSLLIKCIRLLPIKLQLKFVAYHLQKITK